MAGPTRLTDGFSPINRALGWYEDFREEKSALQDVMESRGHILFISPKCHLELAELSIEYSQGKSKLEYSRYINDENPKVHQHLEGFVSQDGVVSGDSQEICTQDASVPSGVYWTARR